MEEFHPDTGGIYSHNWWYKSAAEAEADGYKKFDWKQNPWAALPQWMEICAQKR